MEVTLYAKILFVNGENLIIDTNDLPINDPWPGTRKALSVVYKHENQIRVFVAPGEEGRTWTLEPGPLKNDSNTTLAHSYSPPGGSYLGCFMGLNRSWMTKYTNCCIILQPAGKRWRSITTFSRRRGTFKSAAIIYIVNNEAVRSISGREWDVIKQWSF